MKPNFGKNSAAPTLWIRTRVAKVFLPQSRMYSSRCSVRMLFLSNSLPIFSRLITSSNDCLGTNGLLLMALFTILL